MRMSIAVLLGLALSATVQATTHRTFVAASGTDSGSCGPTAPCRTLSYAQSQTNQGGEIVITQSGGYGDATGGLTIDKSISIIAEPGVFAALAPTSGNGITLATAGIDVALKGLTINGRGGEHGIHMSNGSSLDLDTVTISNFPLGWGVVVQTLARVTIKGSTFRYMSGGMQIGAQAKLMVQGTKLTEMIQSGIRIDSGTSGTEGNTTVVIATETLVRCTGNSSYGIHNYASPTEYGRMYLDRVTVANCDYGVINNPRTPNAANVIALSNSFVTGNVYGLINNPGDTFLSSGNNHAANNSVDTVGIITDTGVFK